MVYGMATAVHDPVEKRHALRVVTDHNLPGRSDLLRPATDEEMRDASGA
jgi:hypothetical protein